MILTTEGLGHPQFGVKYKKIQVKRQSKECILLTHVYRRHLGSERGSCTS